MKGALGAWSWEQGCEFACCLCLPESRQSPCLPVKAQQSSGRLFVLPCRCRQGGRTVPGRRDPQSTPNMHWNREMPVISFKLQEDGQYDPRIECGCLLRTLWSPTVFMGFKRLQRHACTRASPASSVQWSDTTTALGL